MVYTIRTIEPRDRTREDMQRRTDEKWARGFSQWFDSAPSNENTIGEQAFSPGIASTSIEDLLVLQDPGYRPPKTPRRQGLETYSTQQMHSEEDAQYSFDFMEEHCNTEI